MGEKRVKFLSIGSVGGGGGEVDNPLPCSLSLLASFILCIYKIEGLLFYFLPHLWAIPSF